MAFGQQSGPPATARQLKDLMALLEQAGYGSFREARGPLGFSQRQGGGKFTGSEAAQLIEQLEAEAEAGPDALSETALAPAQKSPAKAKPAKTPVVAAAASTLAAERREARLTVVARDLPPHILARELERRGWILIPPEGFEPTEA